MKDPISRCKELVDDFNGSDPIGRCKLVDDSNGSDLISTDDSNGSDPISIDDSNGSDPISRCKSWLTTLKAVRLPERGGRREGDGWGGGGWGERGAGGGGGVGGGGSPRQRAGWSAGRRQACGGCQQLASGAVPSPPVCASGD